MKRSDATKLVKELANVYSTKEDLPDIEFSLWVEIISSKEYTTASNAIKSMLEEIPPCRTFGRMPEIKDFKELYQNVELGNVVKEYCPCCAGTGWIYFEKENKTVRCDCSSPIIQMHEKQIRVRSLSETFTDADAKCIAFECVPTDKFPCPFGTRYFNGRKIEKMKNFKENHNYQKGVKLLKESGRVEKIVDDLCEDLPF